MCICRYKGLFTRKDFSPFRYYRQQTKLQEGNIFTGICQSFCSQGMGRDSWRRARESRGGRYPKSGVFRAQGGWGIGGRISQGVGIHGVGYPTGVSLDILPLPHQY